MPEKLKLKSRLVRNATPPSPALSEKEKSDLRQKWGIAPDKRIFGFVGAVNKTKGADIAIDAFCQANPENAHLLMIGEGPLRQSLEDKHLISRISPLLAIRIMPAIICKLLIY